MDIKMLCTKKKQNIYKMWEENEFVDKIWREELKVPSFAFGKQDDKTPEETLKRIFGIKNEQFSEKYQQAISGDGKEEENILTYHSSALCALLHFHNVENNKIKIRIDGKEIIFNKSYFEWKNKVINKPSNMDIVLISEDSKTALFLESKFSEYLNESKYSNPISNRYLDNKYSKDVYSKLNESNFIIEKGKDDFKITLNDESKRYYDGIKQMISHYVGIKNIIHDTENIEEKDEKKLLEKQKQNIITNVKEIYLGTILYDKFEFEEFGGENNPLKRYKEIYKRLSEIMNDVLKSNNESKQTFKVIEEVLTYSDVFNNMNKKAIDENVKKFYNY